VRVFADELDSVVTQLSFKYYHAKFCSTEDLVNQDIDPENIGELILGESVQETPYMVAKCHLEPKRKNGYRFT
jgi:hypothetical protein